MTTKLNKNQYAYILYDGLAKVDIDKANVLSVSESLKEAKQDAKDLEYGEYVIYSYDIDGETLINPKIEVQK